jgi:hypothetical protein
MEDSAKRTPQQFGFWQLLASPIAEAKLAPNIAFSIKNNPIDEGDSLQIELGIENMSAVYYDSSNLNIKIVDDARIVKYESNITVNPMLAFSNSKVLTKLPTLGLQANNQLQFSLNNDRKINELTYINNYIANNFLVKNDKSNPYIDVTFDGVKIMNGDIVSATPIINITSADNNKYILQKDTVLFNVMIRKPNNFDYERVNLNSNEIQFIPATDQNNKKMVNMPLKFKLQTRWEIKLETMNMKLNLLLLINQALVTFIHIQILELPIYALYLHLQEVKLPMIY